jgi:hypothetical protein
MEFPFYSGPEGKLKVRFIHTKTIPEGVRLVYHQIESVKTRTQQAKKINDLLERLHFDLFYKWNKFNSAQKNAFTEYVHGLIGKLAQNPLLLKDENKIHAIERLENAGNLLIEGKATAASAVIRGIKNNMGNWLRKLELQNSRLERRRSLVTDKKFQKDVKIFSAVDEMLALFTQLRNGIEPRSKGKVADNLLGTAKKLYSTGLKRFKQPGIIIEKAAELVKQGNYTKARVYIKDANKKTVLAASEISSIYPDKLKEIIKSKDLAFKEKVLENQVVLFHDMMALWWNPKNKVKTELITETTTELSLLAESIGRKDVGESITKARTRLGKNNLVSFGEFFAEAGIALNPSLAKVLLE